MKLIAYISARFEVDEGSGGGLIGLEAHPDEAMAQLHERFPEEDYKFEWLVPVEDWVAAARKTLTGKDIYGRMLK